MIFCLCTFIINQTIRIHNKIIEMLVFFILISTGRLLRKKAQSTRKLCSTWFETLKYQSIGLRVTSPTHSQNATVTELPLPETTDTGTTALLHPFLLVSTYLHKLYNFCFQPQSIINLANFSNYQMYGTTECWIIASAL